MAEASYQVLALMFLGGFPDVTFLHFLHSILSCAECTSSECELNAVFPENQVHCLCNYSRKSGILQYPVRTINGKFGYLNAIE